MSEERSEDWELSKENIQPIQQGRKPKVLKVALASHTEDLISHQRQSYESELRTYSGDDPLAVWCKYISWVEQNFPKGGREGHIKQLIERCLSILKNEKKYYDDDRFIDIMLKYAILGSKPIDVYSYMFSHNIGCKSAKFFIHWSWELEQLGSLKKADEILIEGLQRKAQPFEKLSSYYKDFEIRLAKKIKANSEKNLTTSESSRSAFAMLKPQKKILAPISRTGEAVVENRKMPLVLGRQQPQPKSMNASVKVPFKIHDSENISSSLPPQLQCTVPSNLNSENHKENEQNLCKWNKVKVKTHDQNLKTSNAVKPAFKFHCDDENEQDINTPRSVPKISKILSTRGRTPSPPIALFEPPDPSKKPMYPKSKVYGGAEEFSLEEIRAAEWLDKQKKTEQEKLLLEQQKIIEEKQKTEEELKKKVEYLAKQVEFFQSHFLGSVPDTCKSSNAAEFNCLESDKTENNKFNKKLKSERTRIKENCENSTLDVYSNLQKGFKSQSIYNSENSLKNRPVKNYDSHVPSESNDPNGTKFCEAAEIVQEFFNRTLPHSAVEDDHMQILRNEFQEKCSVISTTNLSNLNVANQHKDIQNSILKDSNCNLPFSFYHDPTRMIPSSEEVDCSTKCLEKEENPSISPNEVSSTEDIENIPPKDYIQESSKRVLAGILEPSKNILFIPLEEQEEMEDHSDTEENYICHSMDQYTDDTLIPPSNTEQFSAAQFLSSTPYLPRNKSPNFEKTEHETASSESNNVQVTQHLLTESSNVTRREFDQDNTVRTELKCAEQNSLPRLPKVLSVIMETSSEAYSKSSSSSSASLTRSNNHDQLSSHRISIHKQYSKLETFERSALSSVSETSNGISNINYENICEGSLKKFNEIDPEVQLHVVDFDPFDQEINLRFLNSIDIRNYKNLNYVNKSMKGIKGGENICIGNESYTIISLIAEGAYAKVFEAIKCTFVMSVNTKKFALKVCKNSNEWEFYICSTLQQRLSDKKLLPDIRHSVMNIISAEKFLNGIILVSDFGHFGTLLDLVNFCKKQNSAMPELVVMYFTLEILLIVSKLHECSIIHGDIKPDNFLLTNTAFDRNSIDKLSQFTTSLQLIDFGRAVDLNFYDKGICFSSVFSKDHFKCNEMKENRPWVFQLDWYGVASCIHTMLFSDYMIVRKKDGVWELGKKLKRYWCTSFWDSLFNKLLNIPECYREPDIKSHISTIESKLQQNSANFFSQFKRLANSYETGK